jgi:hypothetical protein
VYTLAGATTSVVAGGTLGLVGAVVLPDDLGSAGGAVALAVALVAVARDSGRIAVPLPQFPRQTEGLWAKRFGARRAALLWGLDLGFAFTTWLNLSGAWVLATLAVLSRDAAFGALLFAAYWLGRALSVWIAPALMPNATETHRLMATLDGQRALFRSLHLAGLVWVLAVLASSIATGTTI